MTHLHIGCGHDHIEGAINLDKSSKVRPDILFDLERVAKGEYLPLENQSVDKISAFHVLEHITNILPVMEELHRVAMPDAEMYIRVPHGASTSAFDDPTHVRQMFPLSFTYFSQPAYHRADYGYCGDWEVEECSVVVPKALAESLKDSGLPISFCLNHMYNIADEIIVLLRAVHPARPRDPDLLKLVEVGILFSDKSGQIIIPNETGK